MKDEIKEILDNIDGLIIPSEKWNTVKEYMIALQEENERLNIIKNELKKYLTSRESMEIIGQYENPKSNKGLDEKTMVEMIRRYLIIHDKLLDILELKGEEK